MIEINGFNNYYITTCGEIISKRTNNKMSKTIDNVGYYWVGLIRNDGVLKKIRIHRFMGENYLNMDYSNKSIQINHIDHNKLNNSILNLELVSNSVNTDNGYKNSSYTTRNKIKIMAKKENETLIFNSLRELESKIGISRKIIPLIISGVKPNNTPYEFSYIDYSIPYWIKDEFGNEYQSCRNCSMINNFDEGRFRDKYNNSGLEFKYKKIKFYKFLKD